MSTKLQKVIFTVEEAFGNNLVLNTNIEQERCSMKIIQSACKMRLHKQRLSYDINGILRPKSWRIRLTNWKWIKNLLFLTDLIALFCALLSEWFKRWNWPFNQIVFSNESKLSLPENVNKQRYWIWASGRQQLVHQTMERSRLLKFFCGLCQRTKYVCV